MTFFDKKFASKFQNVSLLSWKMSLSKARRNWSILYLSILELLYSIKNPFYPTKIVFWGNFRPKTRKHFFLEKKIFFQFFWKKCCHFTLKMSTTRQQKFIGKNKITQNMIHLPFFVLQKHFFWPFCNLGLTLIFQFYPLRKTKKMLWKCTRSLI